MPNTNSAVVRPSSTRRRGHSGKITRGHGQSPISTSAAATGRNAVRAALEALEPRQMLSVSTSGGWTNVAPGGGSKVVYVSATGSDGNNGSQSSPVKSLKKAESLIRNGAGDQILLKRGDTFRDNFGYFKWSGTPSQPTLIGTYGSGNRPVVSSGTSNALQIDPGTHDVAVIGIKFDASGRGGSNPDGITTSGRVSNILVEDCEVTGYHNNLTFQAFSGSISNIKIRRSVITDSYSSSAHSQGIYGDGVHGLLLEENVFDHNGWGHGAAQTMFNHDAYITATSSGLVAKGNVFSNASAFGLQARPGGDVQNNLFYNNANGFSFGLVSGSGTITPGGVTGTVANNVVLGGHSINGLAAGQGISLGNIRAASVVGNVIAYQYAGARTPGISIESVRGTTNAATGSGTQNLTIANNVVYKYSQAIGISGLTPGAGGTTGLRNLTVTNNDFQAVTAFQAVTQSAGFNSSAEHWSNNTYEVPGNQKTPVIVGGQAMTISAWTRNDSGGQNTHVNFPSPRNLSNYDANFIAQARSLSKTNWNVRYMAASVVSYIKGGFGMSGGSSSIPVISAPQTSSSTPSPTPTTNGGGSTSTTGPKVTINDVSAAEGNSGSKAFTFTVRLSAASKSKVTVNWKTQNLTSGSGKDYVAASGTTTFNPGETTSTIKVTVNGDKTKEGNDTFAVDLASATNASIADGQGVGKILNDD